MTPEPSPASPESLPDDLLEELTSRLIGCAGDDRDAALAELAAAHPERAEALRRAAAELEATERLLDSGLRAAANELPRDLGDYRLENELGRGGMGVVYAGVQRSLGRRVAVKVLSTPLAHHQRALARFQREGQVLAKLEHKGIVRVIDAGIAEGVPFCAMEFVDGTTLADVLAAVRRHGLANANAATISAAILGALRDTSGSAPASTRGATGYVHAVVHLAAQVAEALAFAHAAGVIHRDVKPSNVLLRRDGSAVLSDFGLARIDDDPSVTLSGDFTGTPHYASPEQARGERLDHRSDVFSLGVMLYEMLTLARPFDADGATAVLRRIQRDEPQSPSRLNPQVPDELAAVVLKALTKPRDARYSNVGAMAADLRAVLEGRPVSARPPTTLQRLYRWSQREPWKAIALATVAAAAIVVAVVTAAFTERLWSENQTTKSALALAQRNFESATTAVDEMLTRVGERDLADTPQMETVRRDLLQRALDFYQGFVAQRPGDRGVALQLAIARGRMAWVQRLLDDNQRAIDSARQAIGEFDALLAADPTDGVAGVERARVQVNLSSALAAFGDSQGALAATGDVTRTLSSLRAPTDYEYDRRQQLGYAYYQAATVERYRDPQAARADLERAATELEWVQAQAQGKPHGEVTATLVNARRTLARIAVADADFVSADRLLHVVEADLQRAPATAEVERQRCAVESDWQIVYLNQGKLADAEAAAQRCVEAWQRHCARHPNLPMVHSYLADAFINLGNCRRYNHDDAGAASATREAVAIYERLSADSPDVVPYREGLGRALINLGSILVRGDSDTGHSEGAAVLQRVSELAEELHRSDPAENENTRLFADALNEIAYVASEQGDHTSALANYQRAADLWDDAIARSPSDVSYSDALANVLASVASEQLQLDHADQALATTDRGLAVLRANLDKGTGSPSRNRFLCRNLGERALACTALGDHTAARAALAEFLAATRTANDALWGAETAATCLRRAPDDQHDAYGAAVLAALNTAVDRGYHDADALASDARYGTLRDGPDFAALLRRMAQ